MISNSEIVIRLLLSALLGGLIGMEREANNRPAGLRTHVLVTIGSALIMMISIDGFRDIIASGRSGDPGRIAAQVVSGIGFLGAGTIMQNGNNITGLTTAASLWVCGGIGLAIGSGYYFGALITVAIILFTLMKLGGIEKSIMRTKYKIMAVSCDERPGLVGEIGCILGNHSMDIRDIRFIRDSDELDNKAVEIHFALKVPHSYPNTTILESICSIKGVEKAGWIN